MPPLPAFRRLHPAAYIALWILMSSAVIVFNKWILDNTQHDNPNRGHFPYPIFLTTWHMFFMTLVTRLLRVFTPSMLPSIHHSRARLSWRDWSLSILPIGVLFSASLIVNNYVYLYLSVAFIQMLKAKAPLVTLVLLATAGMQTLTRPLVVNIVGVVLGVMLASYGEIEFHWLGFICQELGILFESLRLVLVEKLMADKLDPLSAMYFFAPVCGACNLVMFLVVEYAHMPEGLVAATSALGYGVLLANACAALLLNVALVLVIDCTSSLVLTLSGVLKDILLIVVSMTVFGTRSTATQSIGYAVALVFLTRYKTMNFNWRKEYQRVVGWQEVADKESGEVLPQ
ncbi:triose-phosphate transporter family-domain-containing protein [Catenaria anguillulae PL171]|uniref:Triose-phosphate transporter family-domain-containing protein n=1 Tax=Catenaria anguillulae PL171 TaxID=765915 RepID=A0A1Y2HKL6_9FUNG|nr:triose-phosphate transporter family-domain-containing protein [Catenaria anguillulae PL171]